MHERQPVEQAYFCDNIYLESRSFCVFEFPKIRNNKHFSKSGVLDLMEKISKNKKEATRNGLLPEDFYMTTDGFMVFTEAYHLKRGYCCKNGCRHCPYGFRKE
jgi:Family of unknown function (DUF5522)